MHIHSSSYYRAALTRLSPLLFGLAIVACGDGSSTTTSSGSGGDAGTGGMSSSTGGTGGMSSSTGGTGGMMGTGGAGGMMGTGGAGGMGGGSGMSCGGSTPCSGALWSKRFGDANVQFGEATAVDAAGNILLTGSFQGTVDFGGGALTSAGIYDNFIAKFDPGGNHLWSKHFGDASSQQAYGTAVDAAGNVLITGEFRGTVDFGGGALTSAGSDDIFIAKFDPNGNHLWSKHFGDSSSQKGIATAIDASGNVLLTGYFGGTVDFGGGALASAGNSDIFVAKFDPDGNHVWSKRFGDASPQSTETIALDAAGNVVLSGSFGGVVDFGGGPLTNPNNFDFDIFVAKLDPAGNHLWSKRFGDTGEQIGRSAAVDAAGNVLLTGYFQGSVDFGGGTLANMGGNEIFLIKLDPDGNHLWSKSFGDVTNQVGRTIAVDGTDNILLAGYFQGTVDFGGGLLTSAGMWDTFVTKLDPGGNHLWSKRFGDSNNQNVQASAVDAAGNILITGDFSGTMDFGNGPLTNAGGTDIFLAKLPPDP